MFITFGLSSFFTAKKWLKEYIIVFVTLAHQVIITMFFNPYLLEQRLFFQCIIWLAYIIVLYPNIKNKYKNFLSIIYIIAYISFSIKSYK